MQSPEKNRKSNGGSALRNGSRLPRRRLTRRGEIMVCAISSNGMERGGSNEVKRNLRGKYDVSENGGGLSLSRGGVVLYTKVQITSIGKRPFV